MDPGGKRESTSRKVTCVRAHQSRRRIMGLRNGIESGGVRTKFFFKRGLQVEIPERP